MQFPVNSYQGLKLCRVIYNAGPPGAETQLVARSTLHTYLVRTIVKAKTTPACPAMPCVHQQR
ncbi:MAG: hypothetical protein HY686_08730 [Chloroflexi bacterium]|nr:hypothetical protein [Chloroflexota bacterium]